MRIMLTGGGTGGHIFPNIAVFEELRSCDVLYIGEKHGMEEMLCARYGIPFYGISAGKFRRYFSWQNFVDLLKIPLGFLQALIQIFKFKPQVIFSKGGYVAFPLVFAAFLLRRRIVIHDSDSIPGLATRISSHFADAICLAWKEARSHILPKYQKKIHLTGIPLRHVISTANRQKGLELCGFTDDLPIVLVVGGSTGASSLNDLIWASLPKLLPHCQVVHFCGKGKMGLSGDLGKLKNLGGLANRYKVFESLDQEYAHVLAASDLVVSRAGANALFEFIALEKPNILIPLGKKASRGDQIENARIMERCGGSIVFQEEMLTVSLLEQKILELIRGHDELQKMRHALHILRLRQRESVTDVLLKEVSIPGKASLRK